MDGSVVARGVLAVDSRATVPTEEEMARISPYLGEAMERTSLYVRRMALANTGEDRGYTRIPLPILERLAETLPGKAVLLSHDDERLPVGLWYHAEVRSARAGEHGTHTLEARFYMTRDESLRPYQSLMDAGVLRYGSIAFKRDRLECDVCARPMRDFWKPGSDQDCEHYAGQLLPDGRQVIYAYVGELRKYESYEGSLVSLGRQKLAQIIYNDAGVSAMDEVELRRLVGQIEERLAAKFLETDAVLAGLLEQMAQLTATATTEQTPEQQESDTLARDDAVYEDALQEVARLEALLGKQDDARARLMTRGELVVHKRTLTEEVGKRFPTGAHGESAARAARSAALAENAGRAPGRRLRLF